MFLIELEWKLNFCNIRGNIYMTKKENIPITYIWSHIQRQTIILLYTLRINSQLPQSCTIWIRRSSTVRKHPSEIECKPTHHTESIASTCCLARYFSLRSFWERERERSATKRIKVGRSSTWYKKVISHIDIKTYPFIYNKTFTNHSWTSICWGRLLASF